jgi:hypothetical protein
MNNTPHDIARAQQDRFGHAVAARLSAGTTDLPHDFSERLRAARMQALARRKPAMQAATTVMISGGQATLSGGDGPRLWHRIAAVLPLIAFVAGLVAIDMVQTERRASEVAEVDAALLTDTLPPSAYADPGFVQFLKSDR